MQNMQEYLAREAVLGKDDDDIISTKFPSDELKSKMLIL